MTTPKDKEHLKLTISSILQNEQAIQFAYLYGSTVRRSTRKYSDVDIGIFISKEILKKNKFYPERIASKIEKKIHLPIDVRVLNDQSLIFLHQVLKYGELVNNNNNKRRVQFETRVIDEYLDFKYYIDRYNNIRRENLSS